MTTKPYQCSRKWARPHPNPLPQEREQLLAALEKSLASDGFPSARKLLPLLGGEGRGEGERSSQLNCSVLVFPNHFWQMF